MNSEKTLTNFAVWLSFWTAIVLLLLIFNVELGNKAIATPIAADNSLRAFAAGNIPIPEMVSPAAIATPPAHYTEITGELSPGESFEGVMKRLDLADSVRSDIIKGFSATLDFKVLQPGDRFTVSLDQDNSIVSATYVSGPLNTHILTRGEDGAYLAARQAVPLECRIEKISGVIESSLSAAFAALGEEPKLIHAFADIFASKIDFNTETRDGDRFEILVEKYFNDDVLAGYGRILAARYQQKDVVFAGYFFAAANAPAGYFDENGEALGTWFVRSPIPFGRVTSGFTMRRKHPIDGVVRPHLGVDLAAPQGTPVMAAADGKVEYIGRKGGFGNTVILRHPNGYKTYYGHLKGFKKGLKQNSTVAQKEIIGYVGSTGISTGPHLDYRIQHNGVFRNPFGIKFQAKTILQGDDLALFHQESTQTAQLFNTDTSVKILQVKNVILSDDNRISFL